MIELTPEMEAAARKRMGGTLDPWMTAAICDVLDLVERDYDVSPKLPPLEHRVRGEIWWNHYSEAYGAECVCGETFTGWPRSDAEDRLLEHLEREAGAR